LKLLSVYRSAFVPDRHPDIECAPADGGAGLDRRWRVNPSKQCTPMVPYEAAFSI